MRDLIKLMRPKHYAKNLLILLPLIFSGQFFECDNLLSAVLAFCSFSLVASFVYIINDIKDKEKDMLHERKKFRPIASGKVSITKAVILGVVLLFAAFVLNYFSSPKEFVSSSLILAIYILINILYSFGLKNIPLLDITILMAGFLLRVLYGSMVFDVIVSNWLYLTVIVCSFYLSFGKRREEILKTGEKTRKVLNYYNKDFLEKCMYMFLTLTIVFYSLWCVDINTLSRINENIIYTVPVVILICLRYMMLVEQKNVGDPVEVVFSDKAILLMIFSYMVIILFILYIL